VVTIVVVVIVLILLSIGACGACSVFVGLVLQAKFEYRCIS
jgi:hypothetical protein